MILLAIEQSTNIGSVAVLNSQNVLGERKWIDKRTSTQLFDVLADLLKEIKVNLKSIEIYAVGLGPGSYTGLRISIAAAKAFALPGARVVYGLSSANVLAWSIFEELSPPSVTVIGDARREKLWLRQFQSKRECLLSDDKWHLITIEELMSFCRFPTVCVTSDYHRIGKRLQIATAGKVALVEERKIPSAGCLGKLIAQRSESQIQSEPLSPIYLHPAVSVPAKKKL